MLLTIDNALSGALGALVILLLQEVRASYKQQTEDLIGTIQLVHSIRANLNAIGGYTKTILLKTSSSINELTEFDKSVPIKLSIQNRYVQLTISELASERSTTLKYSSLNCFFTIAQVNKSVAKACDIIKVINAHANQYRDEYPDIDRENYNLKYIQSMNRGLKTITSEISNLLQKHEQLLGFALDSFKHLRFTYFLYRKEITEVKEVIEVTQDILNEVTATIEQILKSCSEHANKYTH